MKISDLPPELQQMAYAYLVRRRNKRGTLFPPDMADTLREWDSVRLTLLPDAPQQEVDPEGLFEFIDNGGIS